MFKIEWNLKNRFLVPVLSVVILSSLLTTILNYVVARNGLAKAVDVQLLQMSGSLADKLDTFLEERRSDISHIATTKDAISSALNSRDDADHILTNFLKENPIYNSIDVINADGLDV